KPQEGTNNEYDLVDERTENGVSVRVEKLVTPQIGKGTLNLDLLLYSLAGVDLSTASKATLETLRLPTRLLIPFLVLIGLSYVTPRTDPQALDRYFAKMNTPVDPDPDADERLLKQAYADPSAACARKLFPNSEWEFVKPTVKDVVGFAISCIVCVVIIGLLTFLAGIGAG
ncbi:MAG: hypothetical protein AAGI63_15565, partial [Planctomycetota bacterium]